MRHIGFYNSGDAVQTAINDKELGKPYVVYLNDEHRLDWNSKNIDYAGMPLTFEIISGGTITWKAADGEVLKTISYSKDNGLNWTDITSTKAGTSFSVAAGDKVLFKGENTTYAANGYKYNGFSDSTAVYNVYGNIMSLVGGDNFSGLTTLENSYVFCSLFRSTKVNDASSLVLPATALTQSCYRGMFQGCTSLVNAPTLPATTLANYCYRDMFQGCTSLVNAPELPATTLANYCYGSMFRGCTSLVNAPTLPATALAQSCYQDMFWDCTSLENAPELPATALAQSCYVDMFWGCTSLVNAPELPATTLANYCYGSMFRGCTSLNYIKCLATDISASLYTYNWLRNVSPTGTFVKHPDATWTTGDNGIPTGWTVEDAVIAE